MTWLKVVVIVTHLPFFLFPFFFKMSKQFSRSEKSNDSQRKRLRDLTSQRERNKMLMHLLPPTQKPLSLSSTRKLESVKHHEGNSLRAGWTYFYQHLNVQSLQVSSMTSGSKTLGTHEKKPDYIWDWILFCFVVYFVLMSYTSSF